MPNLSYLRVPNYKAYIYIPKKTRRSKLVDRGKLYYFVGYDSNSIFVVYNLETGGLRRIRDVRFVKKSSEQDKLTKIDDDGFDSNKDIIEAPLVNYLTFYRKEPLSLT